MTTIDLDPPIEDPDQAAPRRVPHNTPAERALIGSWLLSTEARTHHVNPADFYHPTAATIATAIHQMAANGAPIDVVTVTDHLERTGQLDRIGGPATPTSLVNAHYVTGHAHRYAAIIRRDAHLRRLLNACRDLTDAIYTLDDTETTAATWRLLHVIAEEDETP